MASDNATIQRSVLLRQWTWPLRVAFWTAVVGLGVWAFGMLAQAGWARHIAPADPMTHLESHLSMELATLASMRTVLLEPAFIARTLGDGIHGAAKGLTTLVARTLMNIPGPTRQLAASDYIRHHPDPGGAYAEILLRGAGADWNLLVLGTYSFAVRTAMYLAMWPVLCLFIALGAVDGLVARSRRKANAGRESASLYHRAKMAVSFVLICGYLVTLGVPQVADPNPWLTGIAALVGLTVRAQVKYYKKYL